MFNLSRLMEQSGGGIVYYYQMSVKSDTVAGACMLTPRRPARCPAQYPEEFASLSKIFRRFAMQTCGTFNLPVELAHRLRPSHGTAFRALGR